MNMSEYNLFKTSYMKTNINYRPAAGITSVSCGFALSSICIKFFLSVSKPYTKAYNINAHPEHLRLLPDRKTACIYINFFRNLSKEVCRAEILLNRAHKSK